MTKTSGTVTGVNGNMVTVFTQGTVTMNEVAYIHVDDTRLKSEVIRVQGGTVQVQVFEITRGIKVGDPVDFRPDLRRPAEPPAPDRRKNRKLPHSRRLS